MDPEIYPILDYDPTPEAIIEPSRVIRPRDYSPRAVLCFFMDVIARLVNSGQAVEVEPLISEMGPHPVYRVQANGSEFMLLNPGVGAPLAAANMEEMIARGCRQFIACGGCGVLRKDFEPGKILLPVSALRDEGTSYAYLPPTPEVAMDPNVLASIRRTLERRGVSYEMVKTWTTDAIYRETRARAALRVNQGCSIVEMETAAFMAVAAFRGVEFGQLLYGGDSVSQDGWDPRGWQQRGGIREGLFWLAVEALLDL